MNKLPLKTRVQILTMLCEGSSMRSISRVADVSINTVSKLLVDAGKFCADLHDREVRGVKAKRVQCDEIWSFVGAKAEERREHEAAGRRRWRRVDLDRSGQRQQAYRFVAGRRTRRRICAGLHGRREGPPRQPRPAHHGRPQGLPERGRGGVRGRYRLCHAGEAYTASRKASVPRSAATAPPCAPVRSRRASKGHPTRRTSARRTSSAQT